MSTDTAILTQIAPYQPWLIIVSVLVLFVLLRVTRKALRHRVDTIGYYTLRDKGLLIWFWLNAPGVILHELSHAVAVLLFWPFGFRITSVTFFRIRQTQPRAIDGRGLRNGGRQSLQLGEVQYKRPQGRLMSYVGDGLSGIAPLVGGTAMFLFLYWVATGYNLWDLPIDTQLHLQLLHPGWPWWTLLFAPYLILTVTSELWPSSADWRGARWFVSGLLLLVALALGIAWYAHYLALVFAISTFVAARIDFALAVLLTLDLCFLIIAEILMKATTR